MSNRPYRSIYALSLSTAAKMAVVVAIIAIASPFNIFSTNTPLLHADTIMSRLDPEALAPLPDSVYISLPDNTTRAELVADSISFNSATDSLSIETLTDSAAIEIDPDFIAREFVPSPTRAMWLSALCPGLGQVYNRRYWKLPIIIGGYMGLAYATSWNNRMLTDYTRAYRDITDNDPSTKSYMDFYPPTVQESSLNKTWLEKTFKSKKDFYRRNRDLCIISMIGVYMIALLDAYVDASLANFDVTPDLTLQIHPTVIRNTLAPSPPSFGMMWALNF